VRAAAGARSLAGGDGVLLPVGSLTSSTKLS
jgi:hypothetical protein